MSWEPNQQYLDYLVGLLRTACTVNDTEQQRKITKAMDDFLTIPESDRYLCMIFVEKDGIEATIRSMAGLILKNSLRNRKPLPQETISFIVKLDDKLFEVLKDPVLLVRNTVGILLAGVVSRLGREISSMWPQLLPKLLRLCISEDREVAISAAEALFKICEDGADELMYCQEFTVSNHLIPSLLNILEVSRFERVQVAILDSINCFILQDDALAAHLGIFLPLLSQISSRVTASAVMRRSVCQSLNFLMDGYPDEMRSILPSILEYMLKAVQRPLDTSSEEDAAALEAAEFWLSLIERDCFSEELEKVLPQLLPILLANVVYHEDDEDLLEALESDSNADDSIKPRHVSENFKGKEAGEIEDGEEDSCDDDKEDVINSWTVRKCSAASIDSLSVTFGEEIVLPHLLPLINSYFSHGDWKYQEAGILVLGAIAEGYRDALEAHLPGLLPFLFAKASSQNNPVVRSIATWTISRFAAAKVLHENHNLRMQATQVLLEGLLSTNSRLQLASCTALSVYSGKCPLLIMNSIDSLLEAIKWCCVNYKQRSLASVFDLICSICDYLETMDESYGQVIASNILPLLLPHYSSYAAALISDSKNSSIIFSLLEAVCALCICGQQSVAPFAQQIMYTTSQMLDRSLKIIYSESSLYDIEGEQETVMICLDVIGALAQSLRNDLAVLLNSMGINLSPVIISTMNMDFIYVQTRQASFALIGDLALCSPSCIEHSIIVKDILPAIAENMDPFLDNVSQSTANNAIWALGELAIRFPQLILPHCSQFITTLTRFLTSFTNQNASRGFMENVAVTYGRLLTISERIPANFSHILFGRWLSHIKTVDNPAELHSAWPAIIQGVLSQSISVDDFILKELLQCIAGYNNLTTELEVGFGKLVRLVRERKGQSWSMFLSQSLSSVESERINRFLNI